jgi:DtxR family Mn-dependent transcriptional regulator
MGSVLSEAAEDYLKAVYLLRRGTESVSTSEIAARLGVAPASVTQMIKKLDGMRPRLLVYTRHRGVTLTPHGERVAVEIIRHHRLIELFLAESLGMSWDEVHAEAEKLEHVISPAMADRIADKLGDPKYDPHGAPIPAKGGRMPETGWQPLCALSAGQSGIIRSVHDADAELLRYLGGLGMRPGTRVHMVEKTPFDGPLHVDVGEGTTKARHILGQRAASEVLVEPR